MRTATRDFALVYFEQRALSGRMKGFEPGARYSWTWFDPRTGAWSRPIMLRTDAAGMFDAPAFAGGGKQSRRDVAAKILRVP